MRQRSRDVWSVVLVTGLACLACVPFTFYLVASLSPVQIHALSLSRVTGEVHDPTTNVSVPIKVTVGPSGGCMWYNTTGAPTRCIAKIPFVPDADLLHLPSNQTLTKSFPIAMGRALALNHVMTILCGLSLLAVLVDVLVLHGGACLVVIYLTVIMMWITFILETIYISVLHKRLDDNNSGFDYHVGPAYWMILAATITVSLLMCGDNGSVEISVGGD
ncbi:hypothetical protein IAU59_003040 [Kwoniella sp. CBS 9459]